jgi:hypothetical protein
MFPSSRSHFAGLILAILVLLLGEGSATAQSTRQQQRLASLQQRNALQQQQDAVQTALQQTTSLLQIGRPNLPNLQQQQNALQIAIQQTNALLQASFRTHSALSQMALQQLNTLQTVQQQTISLQGQWPLPNAQLSPFQLQILWQEQNSLLGLLTAQLPPPPRRISRR